MGLFNRKRDKNPPKKKYDVLADEVRVKGATRPSHLRPEGTSAADVQRAHLERVLQAFLSATNWEATHVILEREQATLLGDDAQVVLRDFVTQARQQDRTDAQQMANYIEAHRLLLERARAIGVDAAWQEFRERNLDNAEVPDDDPNDPEAQAIVNALKQLLGTESWSDTYSILVNERERLTSQTADQFLSALIQVARQDPSGQATEGVRYLELHRTLLRETRTLGLEAAWQNFDRTRRQLEAELARQPAAPNRDDLELATVARALKALLSTENWSETRAILERDQRWLLTDACDRLLSELLEAAQRDDDPRALRGAVYLGLHRRLLRRSREVGIDTAWHEFELALAEAMSGRSPTERDAVAPTLFDEEPEAPSVPEAAEPPSAEDVASAVAAFLSAANWGYALDILYARQHALLSKEAVALVHAQAEALRQRGMGRDIFAAQLLDQQAQVLQRAREVGIDRAWREFHRD